VIVSLDADSTFSTNYFVEIENAFFKPKPPCCAIFGFEHPYRLPGINPENRSAIVKYELYLRYYRWALARTGFPFPFYTIGSCFAVSALAYVKQGGMNRRQAGEDFYFLNKIFLLDKTIELNSIKVYPSCRVSNRVPFGTGAAVTKIISHNEWMVYQLCTFETLQQMFKSVKTLFKQRDLQIESYYFQLSGELKSFMAFDEFNAAINQINNNASSEEVFIKKFFQWFDAFKIIKYLNLIHTEQVPRISIEKAAKQLLLQLKVRFNDGANQEELLEIFKSWTISQIFISLGFELERFGFITVNKHKIINMIRWGIIGAGWISEKFASDFKAVNGGSIVAVAARDLESARLFASKHQIPKALWSYREMVADSEIDVVYIGTTHNFHFKHTMLCFEHEKHVLCEKPITVNASQLKMLTEEAEKRNLFLMEAMWSPFLPPVMKALEWIALGKIGQVQLIKADLGFVLNSDPAGRIYNPALAGGALLDVGIYPLTIGRLVAQSKVAKFQVQAEMSETGIDESNMIQVVYENGIQGHMQVQ
jgi:hypothetical protein